MYYELNEKEQELIKRVEVITWCDFEKQNNFIKADMLINVIEELMYSYEELKEKYEDLQKDLEENYKPIPIDLGMSDRDFI